MSLWTTEVHTVKQANDEKEQKWRKTTEVLRTSTESQKKLKSTEKVLRTYKKVKHPLMKRSRVSILSSVASAAEIILTGTNNFMET